MKSDMLERLLKLQTSANELLLQGKREPDSYIDFLQKFVFGNIFPAINWKRVYEVVGLSAEAVETLNAIKVDPNLWSVPVVKGITCNMVVGALREAMRTSGLKVTTYVNDLDKDVPTNDRNPNRDGSYVVGFRRTIEADEENANKSANQLKAKNHKGITLLERLLLELGYFMTTGQNLDVVNITLCSGSRDSGGGVPSVDFDGGRVRVYWYSSSHFDDGLRSRSAVS